MIAVFDRAMTKGADFNGAVRPMLKAVLVSPDFLLRVERDPAGMEGAPYRRVTDHELAVRLSYFLWSSLPDRELRDHADAGRLSDPGVLEQQTRRMLADPRASALTDYFAIPWLQAGNLQAARPSTEYFPSFQPTLKAAMTRELWLFLEGLRTSDRSVLELLRADYTYANAELARHYGLPPVAGDELRRVPLRPEDHRGGVLGMGVMLASTSHTYRTSPTLRGKYVLEVLLGTPPPPPPANVGVLKDEAPGRQPKSFRETLVQHAADPACASCHRRIDPLGFGLESFDAVGRWRSDAVAADVAGTLPSGETFSGPDELKQLLWKRRERFVFHLGQQLLCYALGRPLEDCDAGSARAIQRAAVANEYRLSALVLAVVNSFPFQHRRVSPIDSAAEPPP